MAITFSRDPEELVVMMEDYLVEAIKAGDRGKERDEARTYYLEQTDELEAILGELLGGDIAAINHWIAAYDRARERVNAGEGRG